VTVQNQIDQDTATKYPSYRGLAHYFRLFRNGFSFGSDSRPSGKWNQRTSSEDGSSQKSMTHILPVDGVHVQNEVELVAVPTPDPVARRDYYV
jgi:hypothetical protein